MNLINPNLLFFSQPKAVPQSKKLTFMYLANDVIQNSKKKGPEYGKEFGKILKNVFAHIGETCSGDEKTLNSLGRILKIWEDRGVYDEKQIEDYRSALMNIGEKTNNTTTTTTTSTSKRKSTDATENGRESKKQKTSKEHGKRETIEVNGTVETHVILSPKPPAGELFFFEFLIRQILLN